MGFIFIIVSIAIVIIGLLINEDIIANIGWILFVFSIVYLAIMPIFLLRLIKTENAVNSYFKPRKNYPHCGHSIPIDANKCHICNKEIK